jgi:cell division protein FtsW
VGVALVVTLYGVILWRGVRAAVHATEPFGTYLGLGLSSLIGFQAVVNMCVATGMLPTKGLTLPFISYGGSSLIFLLGAMGLLLSVSTNVRAQLNVAARSSSRYGSSAREEAVV